MATILSPETVTLAAADTVNPRIDRVVLRSDFLLRKMLVTSITGTPAASPVAPDLVRTSSYFDIGLSKVAVAANAAEITQADITDTRADSDVCGWVTGLIEQIDTTGLFAQYNAAFNNWLTQSDTDFDTWFTHLHDELDSNQAANLQNQIDILVATVAELTQTVAELTQTVAELAASANKYADDTDGFTYKLGFKNGRLYSDKVTTESEE